MPRILVDTSAWTDFLRGRGRLADAVRDLVRTDDVWLHPTVAGELRLAGIDVAERTGLPMLPGDRPEVVLAWVRRQPPTALHGVGWADCEIVHGARAAAAALLTADARQRHLYDMSTL